MKRNGGRGWRVPWARTPRPSDGKLGAFLGVFTPTVLTILGVIMFLRFGQVVGQSAAALRNVSAVDAQVAVSWAEGITKDGGPTETNYEEAFTAEFRQGLQRGGIDISEQAPNYLYCTIALLYEENGMVSAAQAIELHEPTGTDASLSDAW